MLKRLTINTEGTHTDFVEFLEEVFDATQQDMGIKRRKG